MKTTILSIFLLCSSLIAAQAQISEKQLKPFYPKGYTLANTYGDGMTQSSGDILLELTSNEESDFKKLILIHNGKNKLTKIAENNNLVMVDDMLGDAGGNSLSLSENTLKINYSQGTFGYLKEVSIILKKENDGQYYCSTYATSLKEQGKENKEERLRMAASQIGRINFANASEELILEKAKTVKDLSNNFGYEPESATISGTITKKLFYGAPNYGKTPEKDEKIWVYILKKEQAINVFGDINPENPETADETHTNISEIQIYSTNKNLDFKNLEDKKVKLQGVFQSAQSGNQFTNVVFQAKKVLK